jgi:hypothetical protein
MADQQDKKQGNAYDTGIVNKSGHRAEGSQVDTRSPIINASRAGDSPKHQNNQPKQQ